MKIETKFNIGNYVFFVEGEGDGITYAPIVNLQIFVFADNEVQIRYNILGCKGALNEKFCFATKQELLNQLH